MVPLNFMTTGKADYLVTGNFSKLAAKEAAKLGEVNIVASSKDKNFTYIPDVNAINYDKDASYIHICQNNTIDVYKRQDLVIRVASGEQTKAEKHGFREISIFKDGVVL